MLGPNLKLGVTKSLQVGKDLKKGVTLVTSDVRLPEMIKNS